MTAHPAPAPRAAHAPVRRTVLPPVLRVLAAAVLLVLAGWLLIPFTGDLPLTRALNTANTGAVGAVAHALYQALEPGFAVVLTAALAGLVALRRRSLVPGLRLGLTVALTWLPVGLVKLAVHRPRPAAAALAHPTSVPAYDWTFPSGHVAFVTALAVAVVLLGRTAASRAVRGVAGVLAVAAIVLAVLVLGVHYPTDVAASILWALAVGPVMWRVAGVLSGPVRRRRAAAQAGVPRR